MLEGRGKLKHSGVLLLGLPLAQVGCEGRRVQEPGEVGSGAWGEALVLPRVSSQQEAPPETSGEP